MFDSFLYLIATVSFLYLYERYNLYLILYEHNQSLVLSFLHFTLNSPTSPIPYQELTHHATSGMNGTHYG